MKSMHILIVGLCALLLAACQGGRELASAPADPRVAQDAGDDDFAYARSRPAGIPVNAIVEQAKATPQRDAWDLPDLRGEYDELIPVPENYPLPERPSRLHDVATIRDGRYLRPRIPSALTTNDGRIGVSMDLSDSSTFGLDTDFSSTGYIRFTLYAPEKLDASGTHYTQAADGSIDFMSDKIWRVPYTDLVPPEYGLEPWMFAVCDTSYARLDHELYGFADSSIHRNPYPVSADEEAYDIEIFSGEFDYVPGAAFQSSQTIFTFTVRVVVRHPKTPQAEIVRIERVGEPKTAQLPFRPFSIFEPNITGDGRLLVTRISGTPGQGGGADALLPRPWTDAQGVEHHTQHDVVYAYNPPDSGIPPCDPRGWTQLKPITYAHYDPQVRERYGFAKFPMRDTEGKLLRPGQESGMTYPWIDRRGSNIMFALIHRLKVSDPGTYNTPETIELLETLSGSEAHAAGARGDALDQAGLMPRDPASRPHLMLPQAHQIALPDARCDDCQETLPREHAGSTRGIGVVGLWTQGKMIVADGIINATDLGYRAFDDGHKLVRLYHGSPGKGGVLRVGNGRTNVLVPPEYDLDSFWPYNDTMMESLENKLFHSPSMKPAAPQDIVWTINDGRGSTEFIFDDYMDNSAVIVSSMVPSVTTLDPLNPAVNKQFKWSRPNTGDRRDVPIRVQNGAASLQDWVPPYGAVIGATKQGTRIEPVALGGIFGRGLWLEQFAGVAYEIPEQGRDALAASTGAYYGLFIDPRFGFEQTEPRRVLSTATGHVSLYGANDHFVLSLSSADGRWQQTVDLPPTSRPDAWTHIGLEVGDGQLNIYLDGFLYRRLELATAPEYLALQGGVIIVGSPASNEVGFRGWVDEFKVYARRLVNAEEACNHSMGSLIRDPHGTAHPAHGDLGHQDIARAMGDSTDASYACHTDYASEGFGFLMKLPQQLRIGRQLRQIQDLQFNVARPDETQNNFCGLCHDQDTHPSTSMARSALAARADVMQLDPRRQPSQPYPVALGHIPQDWLQGRLGAGPRQRQVIGEPGEWFFVDQVLLP